MIVEDRKPVGIVTDRDLVVRMLAKGLPTNYYMALDLAAGKMYWTDIGTSTIARSNLDGSGSEVLVTSAGIPPIGIALDLPIGKMTWTLLDGTIQRANLDGSGIETLLTGSDTPWDITLGTSAPAPGDCDDDGDVDLTDYACFHGCLTGPDGGLLSGCEPFDFDGDTDTDLLDGAAFQVSFTGS